jgi:hypothetical protein
MGKNIGPKWKGPWTKNKIKFGQNIEPKKSGILKYLSADFSVRNNEKSSV